MWFELQQATFNSMKNLISCAPIFAKYNPHEDLTLKNDASGYSMGATLMQKERPVAYANRSDTEQRYAQIEKKNSSLHIWKTWRF